MSKNTPIFSRFIDKTAIAGIASSGYLYSVYTFLPDHIYDPLVTVVPTSGAVSALLLPRLLKGLKGDKVNLKSNEQKRLVVEQINDGNQVTVSEDTEIVETERIPERENTIDESFIQELIDKRLGSSLKEFENTKQQLEESLTVVNNVRNEIDNIKSSVKELKDAFETTLVDFKAFQTEIANPLNFMRKYFESIDIKNLSDPTLPLQLENKQKPLQNTMDETKRKVATITSNNLVEYESIEEHNNHNKKEVEEIASTIPSNGLKITSYINNGKMSLSDIMELVSSLGEFIEEFGDHYHDILATQCKILGLDKEREELLYNIADTLARSNTSADAYIESLYRLATIMNVKDERVDAIYNKLRKTKKRIKSKKR